MYYSELLHAYFIRLYLVCVYVYEPCCLIYINDDNKPEPCGRFNALF